MKTKNKMRNLGIVVWVTIMSLGVNAQDTAVERSQIGNLLVNGNFEGTIGANNIPFGWTSSDIQTPASLSLITTGIRVGCLGKKALKMSLDTVQGKSGDVIQVVRGIKPGKTYNVSFWYKYTKPDRGDGSTGFRVLQWLDANDVDIPPTSADSALFGFEASAFNAINVWNRQTINVTAPPIGSDGTVAKLLINISSGGVTDFIIDDVEIVRKKSTTSKLDIYVDGSIVYVDTEAGEQVQVFDLFNQKIVDIPAGDPVTVLANLPKNKILIIRVDNRFAKVVLR
ncbi:hypothetical protein [Flavobacterium sp.]|uniref:hypothetical protein n=1 Tax=Flavobacterium sp. TaxID=239 RepID=UPI00286E2081|nr:hypothetical protein [Flavobacterium sp.]